jgi:hypothetical protein
MASAWYTTLQQEIARLDGVYLPPGPLAAGQVPSDAEREKIRAFLVFSHAAIEAYLEQRALAIARTALAEFRANTNMRRSLFALVTHCLPVASTEDVVRLRKKKDEPVIDTICKVVARYEALIERNHGIRISNLSTMLEPIGIELSKVDDVWLNTIDSFGTKRGLAAHNPGATFAAKYQTHPDDARKEVQYLVNGQASAFPGLQAVDLLFDAL